MAAETPQYPIISAELVSYNPMRAELSHVFREAHPITKLISKDPPTHWFLQPRKEDGRIVTVPIHAFNVICIQRHNILYGFEIHTVTI